MEEVDSNVEVDILESLDSSSQQTKGGYGLRSKHEIYNKLPSHYTYEEVLNALEQLEQDGYIFSDIIQVRKWAITNEGREYLNI